MNELKKAIRKLDLPNLSVNNRELATYLQLCKFEVEKIATCASLNNDDYCIVFGKGYYNIIDKGVEVGLYQFECGKHKLYLKYVEPFKVKEFTKLINEK